ncbi:hypothetical protein [Bradyrhizobium sp. dw_411]|uniref:hypothetical protein n=1 Tax=Bradyrhizobium sp. dw_411 TaxID=2720082 RepID=UPI001BCB4410|nr:hypothetical protein [Bradyrhizobium sp. dw_411]
MDIEGELKSLAVQQCAYMLVIDAVLSHLARDRTMHHRLTEAFNQAEDMSDDIAVEIGDRYPAVDVMKVRATVKNIRNLVLGPPQPKRFP